MKRRAILFIILVTAAAASRSRGQGQAPPASPSPRFVASEPVQLPAVPADALRPSPTSAVVTVDGAVLTRAEADQQVDYRMTRVRDRIPPDRLPMIRERVYEQVVENFIRRVVLLNEAESRGIRLTPEEETAAFHTIRESLPEGLTLEGVLQNSPIGPERMREEVVTGVLINKLLAAAVTNEFAVSDDEVAAVLARRGKPASSRDHVIAALRKAKRSRAIEAFIERLKARADVRYGKD